MKIRVNEELDIVRILLRDVPIEESDELDNGIIMDYDEIGHVVGFEILNASSVIGDLSELKSSQKLSSEVQSLQAPSRKKTRSAKRGHFPSHKPRVAA